MRQELSVLRASAHNLACMAMAMAANRPFIACPVNYGSFNANQCPSTETRSSIRSAGGDSFGFICSELDVGLPDAGGMADNKMRPSSSPQPPGRHRSIGVLLFFIADCL